MKKIKLFMVLLILPLLCSFFTFSSVAMNTGFSTVPLSEKEKSTFISNFSVALLKEDTETSPIDCFAVREDGTIALGFSGKEFQTVKVYDSNMVFQYGYTFDTSGSFGIEWDNNLLHICLVRDDMIVSVNEYGELVEFAKIENTIDNNSYWNKFIRSSKIETENGCYYLQNKMGILNIVASSYSQLTFRDTDGVETVLYDVNAEQTVKYLMGTIGVLILLFLAVIVIVAQYKKIKNQNELKE